MDQGERASRFVSAGLRRHEETVWTVGSLVTSLTVWEGVVRGGWVVNTFLPAPSGILRAAWQFYASGEILEHLQASGLAFAVGLVLAIALGVPIGMAIGWSPRLESVFAPYLSALYAVPKLALLPIVVLWVGISLWSVAVVVFLAGLFPIVVNLATAVRSVDPMLLRVARSFEAGTFRTMCTIIVPSSVPFFLGSLRLAIIGGLVAVVVGEMYASKAGVGYLVAVTGATLQVTKMFAAVLGFTVSGLVALWVIDAAQRRVERWRPTRVA
jgi:ABC-type nitrate/sulfonate/bicarbonate transport system permease component